MQIKKILTEYIQQYIEHYHNEISFVHTNHTIVDAIINTKLSYANEIGINTVCLIDSNLPDISDTDRLLLAAWKYAG